MPVLKDETIEIVLPFSKAKVKIKKRFSYGSILEFREKIIESEKDSEIELAITLIDSWDFTDDKNKPLEINIKNIKRLDNEDANFLIARVNKAITEKKTSN